MKLAGTVNTGVTSFTAGTTGFTPSTATTGAVTLAGTLGVASGGTGLTSLTAGYIPFGAGTSAFGNSSDFFWDNTNVRLGIGTSSPAYRLDVLRNVNGSNLINIDNQWGTSGANAGVLITTADVAGSGTSTFSLQKYKNGQVSLANNETDSAAFTSFVVGASEVMRLNSAGALLVGVTSNSWASYGGISEFRKDQNTPTLLTISNQNAGSSGSAGTLFTAYGNSWVTSIGTAAKNSNALTWALDASASPPSEKMRLDTSGNFAVGTATTSLAKFTVSSTGQNQTGIRLNNASGAVDNYIAIDFGIENQPASAGYSAYIRGYNRGAADYTSYLTFGTTAVASSPTEKARISSAGGFSVGTTADPGAGAIYATGNITAYYSDARLKTVSGKIENALDKVAQLSGVYYTNNSVAKSFGYDSDEVQVGVLAQDVEAVLPQIVKAAPFDLDQDGNSKSGENYKTVQYERLVPLLIEAINELQAKVKALEAK